LKVVYSDRHRRHDATSELKDGAFIPSREQPSRIEQIRAHLEAERFGELIEPHADPTSIIARIHSSDYVAFLQSVWAQWAAFKQSADPGDAFPFALPARHDSACRRPSSISGQLGYYATDIGSPITAGTWEAAFTGAACALSAQKRVSAGERAVFSLSRPPGHHAYADAYGGYCFLNNAALAAEGFRVDGASRVAIIDVDYHHGNGTQSIFYDRADVLFVSIHADPDFEFPYFSGRGDQTGAGPGEGANRNFPLPAGADWTAYDAALEDACHAIRAFSPDALVISLGADTYRGDPLSTFLLETEDIARIGRKLGALGVASAIVMEGGYAVDALGRNVHAALTGFLEA